MPATVIVGLQWGDEGKGKTTDFLAEQVAMVVRYQGGDNAGHTVVAGSETFKLQLCPSGVLYPHITSVIGNGVVVNPATLIAELDMLVARGIDTAKVRVSRSAHVIMPYHVALDRANESRLAAAKVGTTGRGIGPAYGDRAWRLGLRMEDLGNLEVLRDRIARALPDKNLLLEGMGAPGFRVPELVELAAGWGERLAPHLDDTTWLVQDALRRDDHVLLEGAQGTLLDLDHGSYPYVTSSNPVAGGACTGGGIGPLQVDEVIGVMKAYSTRVGAGPFPTELFDDVGRGIAERGHEFGTVTGRPRRVGWFDTVPLRYAVAVNSNSAIMLNKVDILSGIETIRLCVAYTVDGRRVDTWPSSGAALARATPIYEDFDGWEQPLHDIRSLSDLPENARRYVAALEEHAGVPIVLVSVGPERTQTIERAWRPMRHRPALGPSTAGTSAAASSSAGPAGAAPSMAASPGPQPAAAGTRDAR
jgi:adenylosuccinate synthase